MCQTPPLSRWLVTSFQTLKRGTPKEIEDIGWREYVISVDIPQVHVSRLFSCVLRRHLTGRTDTCRCPSTNIAESFRCRWVFGEAVSLVRRTAYRCHTFSHDIFPLGTERG